MRAGTLEPLAPLHGTVGIAHPLARSDHVASGKPDGHAIGQLSSDHRGIHLIQVPHSIGNIAGRNHRQSLNGSAQHFKVIIPGLDRNTNPFACQFESTRGVAVFEQAERPGAYFKPCPLGANRMAVEKTAGTLKPAV